MPGREEGNRQDEAAEMALKARLTADEHTALASDALQALYKKDGDAFVLEVDGADEVFAPGLKKALESERDANKQHKKLLADLKSKFDGLDPAKAREALKKLEEFEDKELLDAGKVDEIVTKRTERMRQDHQAQIDAMQKQLAEGGETTKSLTNRLYEVLIDAGVAEASTKVGVRPTALQDIKLRARSVWRMEEGKPIPKKDDGTIIYGKKATEPITFEEWVVSLQPDAPHLFEPSRGSGAPAGGGQRGAAGGGVRLTREEARDPQVYRAAKEAAEKAGGAVQIVDA
jgi:hypothetical protein